MRALIAAMLLAVLMLPGTAAAEQVTLFAAASLKTALDDLAARYMAGTGTRVLVSTAASSALARQIEAGAPADIFISADRDWMDHLQAQGLIRAGSRRDLLGSRLVLVAARGREPVPVEGLAAALGDSRLAVADTGSVPAGRYAKAALQSLGQWDALSGRLAQAENVRAALALVARGEAPYGIVYATDAAAEPGVTVAAAFPASSHPPIVYPAALTAMAEGDAASRLLDWLSGEAAAEVFRSHGFTIPSDGS